MHKKNTVSIAGELLRFSLPLIMSGVLQQLYSWADAFIIGHAEGEMQLAAIGATTSLSSFLNNTILGITLGLSIMAAQHFGRRETNTIRRILAAFLPTLCGLYTLLSLAASAFMSPLLQFLGTPQELFDAALSYLRILLWGVPFLACYNLYAALLRAIGNTKAAFYAIVLSSVSNVLLDVLFVVILPFGISGAAAATVISQIGMTVFIVCYAMKKHPDILRVSFKLRKDLSVIREGLRFSAPPAIKNSITSFGHLALQSFMNSFGAVTVLAVTTAYRVDCITLLPIINLGAAISIMTAQAKGAQNNSRIRSCFKTGLFMMILISSLLACAMFVWGSAFIAVFGVTGSALEEGRVFFQDLSIFYPVFGLGIVLQSILEGIGDISFCSIVGVVSLALRITLSYLLRPVFGARTIALAEGFTWLTIPFIFAIRMLLLSRKKGNK